MWWWLAVLFYPVAAFFALAWFAIPGRLDRFSALASGFIVFLVLWLGALPRELAWRLGDFYLEPRFAMPLTAYLIGLAIAAVLMSWTKARPKS